MPIEPPLSQWDFPIGDRLEQLADGDLVAIGADLQPGTLLAAYRSGLFPMPLDDELGWWSPDPRGVLPLDGLRVTKSLRRSCHDFEIRADTAFDVVVAACADPVRDGGWITPAIQEAYAELHRLGWAHSVEAWRDGELVGGLYGVAVGGLFAGESMFHRARDASKVALVGLVDLLSDGQPRLLDVQWQTPHLATLGVVTMPRHLYLAQLSDTLDVPLPTVFVDQR